MNYYNPYTGNKKKILFRILFVLLMAVIIIAATVILGNYLRGKVDPADTSGGVGREDITTETAEPIISIPPSEDGAGSSVSVKAMCIPLDDPNPPAAETGDGEPTPRSFSDRCTAEAEGYTGALIPLTGEGGRILYNSARIAEFSRTSDNLSLLSVDGVRECVSFARSLGLRTTAMIIAGADTTSADKAFELALETDSRIAADAAEAGFDEIIICSLASDPTSFTGDGMHRILRYVNQIVPAAGSTAVGISLSPEIYMTASLSPQIEMLVSRSVFLAMTVTPENSTDGYLTELCDTLSGTLSVYNMRLILSPNNMEVARAIGSKLAAVGHENYQFANVPTPDPAAPVTNEPTTDAPAADPPVTDAPTATDDNG